MFDINKIGNSWKYLLSGTVALCLMKNYTGFTWYISALPVRFTGLAIAASLIANLAIMRLKNQHLINSFPKIDSILQHSMTCVRVFGYSIAFNCISVLFASCGLSSSFCLFLQENISKVCVGSTIISHIKGAANQKTSQPNYNIDLSSTIGMIVDDITRVCLSLVLFGIVESTFLNWINFSAINFCVITPLVLGVSEVVMSCIKEGEKLEGQKASVAEVLHE